MSILLIYVLVCYGLTQILVYGSIFDNIRPKNKFFHCPMCVGFWISGLIYILIWYSGLKMYPELVTGTFLYACLGSGTSYILCQLVGDEGLNIKRN